MPDAFEHGYGFAQGALVVEDGLQPTDEADCPLDSSVDCFSDEVRCTSHHFALSVATASFPAFTFLLLHFVTQGPAVHFKFYEQAEVVRETSEDGVLSLGGLRAGSRFPFLHLAFLLMKEFFNIPAVCFRRLHMP